MSTDWYAADMLVKLAQVLHIIFLKFIIYVVYFTNTFIVLIVSPRILEGA